MVPQWIIEKKRDGGALSDGEIHFFIRGYTRGEIPDCQMAALAMAVFFRGMSFEETACLTAAMLESGRALDTSSVPGPKVDKHSTGGVGDKVSLVLAPLAASCGVAVPMLAGRGLGLTGGTLDKLESISGYRTDLSAAEFLGVVKACGCSISGQTAELAPADRKLYALRDVTGTVPSVPLIAASIMSKKLAAGVDGLVLDVKCGSGAFMAGPDRARELARVMLGIGERLGRRVTAVITDMSQPLGWSAGNALEVREALAALRGEGPPDLMEVTLTLGERMLRLAGLADKAAEARRMLKERLASGAALARFRDMVAAHGGDAAMVDDPNRLPRAALREEARASRAGVVSRADAGLIGRACVVLGAGRRRVEDGVDPAVGISRIVKVGQEVRQGEVLALIHANSRDGLAEARGLVERAFEVGPGPVAPPKLVVELPGVAV